MRKRKKGSELERDNEDGKGKLTNMIGCDSKLFNRMTCAAVKA